MRRLKKYLTIFKDVKIPWILLMIYLVLSMISSHMEVGAMTMTASIIDASQNAIRSDELIEYISVIAVSGILTIATGYLSGISLNTINRGVRVKLWNKIM